jgi:undecaprenyl-diphosphatase
MITYLQALILGLLQGVSELFPISSLGHSVLVADLFNWQNVLKGEVGGKENYFLVFVIVLHVATALALLFYYRREWYRIIKAFVGSLRTRSINTPDAKLAWLLIAATLPAGIVGFVFQNVLRTQFAKPLSAIIFIMINGVLLLAGDHYIRTHRQPRRHTMQRQASVAAARTSDSLTLTRAMIIGVSQLFAFIAGISRTGITMLGGIYSGLSTEDTAHFSFLLATPIILAAGLYQLPEVFGQGAKPIRGEMLLGTVCAAIAAYFSVRFLDKYFQKKSLRPFGIYCISIGAFMLLLGLYRGHF